MFSAGSSRCVEYNKNGYQNFSISTLVIRTLFISTALRHAPGSQHAACSALPPNWVPQLGDWVLQVHIPAKSQSPEFDPAFASEADTMFSFGQPPCGLASSVEQLQRRLRLSDVGLEPSIAQMRPEDALIIHVCAHTCYLLISCPLACTMPWHHATLAQCQSCAGC